MSGDNAERLIVALDVETYEKASKLVELLSPQVRWVKVGSQLFTREGPRICELVRSSGLNLFLDLKFHDIPNTVYGAVRSALELDAGMLTLHTSGGTEMIREAMRAVEESGKRQVMLLGVTVLTHLRIDDFVTLFSSTCAPREMVLNLASLAQQAGLDGVVASAHEVKILKGHLGKDLKVVTPGIRLEGEGGKDDQVRVVTPEKAIEAGADFIVVGRPIIAAQDPAKACQRIFERMRSAEQRD
ncbi:MAG: orotidine-5'-phosphate decarboxylase [Candidatus Latescibacteria bacterium]|nr:orotidine-5'-phosphate decarboxylase [Candidatus Latescibacterota bacterium]NIM22311.1 orotidine-5'-phosphate decarboxylase [Candidatus Latescibacterota bacterium]NIM66140.1 orotidine-5'-phosphate decarboxylase [Candidatus Latescibacterota bacterium]NIO02548.1 orotidine-5'-phosphate decarboxylase [Candidatus Latescibacterota bacterium]NIO29462.1 orotidine-5'-phosphate decarboxylase [Candidatus Latescibacterota bacterium]